MYYFTFDSNSLRFKKFQKSHKETSHQSKNREFN